MADIQVFNHPEFGSIRTLDDGGRTLFCGADIAKALGYSNPRKALTDHCMNDGLFQLREYDKNGNRISGTQTMVTPKGRETFRLLLFGAKKD